MKKSALLLFALCVAFASQAEVAKSLTNMVAGGLKAALTSQELNTVTSLTITGAIDARDFKIMRDNMTALAVIDLSGTTIDAYTGTEGSKGSVNTTYPANEIPERAFYNAATYVGKETLTTFTYPTSTTAISASAFNNCYALSGNLIIPASVTTIGDYAFEGCTGLSGALTIPSGTTTIGAWAFSSCSGFTGDLNIPNTVTAVKEYAFNNCMRLNGKLTIPESITIIENSVFSGCSGLSSITIPTSVTTIRKSAFYGCSGFKGDLSIPASATTIEEDAFLYCSGLFSVDEQNPNFASSDGLLFNKDKTTLIQYTLSKKGNCTIPTSVTTLGKGAFSFCKDITGSLTLPASITTIGERAFFNCSGITGNLTIPESVTTIDIDAFFGCSYLAGPITIPASVTTIGKGAFYYCSRLRSIYALAPQPIDISNSPSIFEGVDKRTCTLYVSIGSKAAYAAANQWSDFQKIVEIDPSAISKITESVAASVKSGEAEDNAKKDEYKKVVSVADGMYVTKVVNNNDAKKQETIKK